MRAPPPSDPYPDPIDMREPVRLAAGRAMPSSSPMPEPALGADPWQLVETAPDAARAALHETLFALGNGRIGVRGAHDEGDCWPGTEQDAIYINGFHDTEDIHYAENAYGLARQNQFIVAVPNGKAVRWRIGDEWFDPAQGRVEDYRRRVDLRTGRLVREFVWVSPQGRRVAVASRRIVCFARPLVYALEYELRALDAAAQFVVEASIDARARGSAASDDPRVGSVHAARALERIAVRRDGERISLQHRTRRINLQLVSAVEFDLQVDMPARVEHEDCGDDDRPGRRYSVYTDAAGQRLRLVRYCALVGSLDGPPGAPLAELEALALLQLGSAREAGFDALCDEQAAELASYWDDADVRIDGDAALQQGLRFNLLHLLQSAGRDGRTNIAAKGVTGSGYDGHYFWDTEIYVLPALLHTRPQIARRLLEFRFHTLDAARARARELHHPHGALFPWRTIAGAECSAYFPAGTAQVHINADIAFAVKRYWEATGDDEFIVRHGAELVFETARIWLSHGHFEPTAPADGRPPRFLIHTVTGPDEYTTLVDNNLYTNAMARAHLRFAVELVEWLRERAPGVLGELTAALAIAPDEPARWHLAAQRMHLPYDTQRGIHPQDDTFLSKPRWDAADMAAANRPLLLHYHPLVISRHQVCKQADVLLAMLLLDEEFEPADKRRNYDYYEPLTTHDSSLSRCIFGIVASEVGYHDEAYRHFVDGARVDLDDRHQNTRHGVHTAAMAGAWLGVVAGFAGLRMRRGVPAFAPHLPRAWRRYAFKLRIGRAQLGVEVDDDVVRYRLLQGESLRLRHHGQSIALGGGAPLEVAVALAMPNR